MRHVQYLCVRVFVILALLCGASARGAVQVSGLQCEYLIDPLGIDVTSPRFTWQLSDPDHTRGQKQTAYQVVVGSNRDRLEQQADLWDSGKVASAQSALVPYAGKNLASGQECFWKIRVFDKDAKPSAWSPTSRFSIGLLKPEDWTGPWIKHPTAAEEKHIWFRQKLSLKEKAASAFIYVASVGYHELYVNGKKVDLRVLAPTVTRLDKRVLYVTYDIASALQPGDNCIALWTGAGWGRYEFFKSKAALRVQLNGKTTGGQPITLASDTTWRCQISNSEDIGKDEYRNHGGEQIDASKYDPHWNTVDCDDSAWPQAVEVPVKQTLSAQMVEPSRFIETIPAQTISGDGPYKVVLAKNFSGWVTINVKGQSPGDPIKIQVSDNLGVVQNFAQLNTYTCSGAPSETFQNRFNYTAGRYVTITGLKNKPELADIEGHAIGTDFNRVGHFTCSSDLFNQIYETDLWTYRANTVEGYTEDCPHRERLGYGEEQFATAWGCGLPNYQTGAFYTNVLRNWRDVQQSNGWFNHTAPQVNRHYGGPMWSSAPLNIGWEFYKTYGDKRALADAYASDKSWIDFLGANVTDGLLQPYNKNYNNGGNFLGDWAAPYGPSDKLKGKEFGTTPEAQLFNNCVYAMNLETVIEMAKVLDKPDDVATYSKRLDDLKHRVHARFFNPQDNNYFDNHQMHLAFPMFVGITSDAVKPAVLANFDEESLQTHPYLNMGSSGLPVLLKFLIENAERNDILFADLSSKVEPGYGYFLARGETAWPEYWDDNCPSRIHTCYTGIASWFIKGLGGIREDPAQFGYQSFIIKPAIVGDLTYAEAKTESLYGPIISRWEKNDAAIQMNVTIPANSTATVYVPAKDVAKVIEGGTPASQSPGIQFLKMESSYAVFQVQSGVYQFNAK